MSLVPLQLSNTKSDFEQLLLQLQLYLSQKATWSDLLTSSTGETLIEMMAAVGAFNQFAIESAAREAYLETAYRDSSIYAITRMLGVRISRKTPASTVVQVARPTTNTSILLPKYTEVVVGGKKFFNRDPVVIPVGTSTVTFTVYEGYKKVQTFAADSTLFREIYLNELDFAVSNEDVEVVLVSPSTGERTLWTGHVDEGIWTFGPTDTVYHDSTSGLGDTILAFGDGTHGALPALGYTIEVTYIITTGQQGNVGLPGQEVVVTGKDLTGKNLTQILGGADQKPSSYYKSLAPHIYRARMRAVTKPDYKAICSSYPNVAAVAIQTQRDVAPNDLRWMNVVRICILPTDADYFSDLEWVDFEAWFEGYKHAAVQIVRYNPIKNLTDINVAIYMKPEALEGNVVSLAETNIRALFDKDYSILGKRIAISDIVDACLVTGVDYVDVITPTADLIPPDDLNYYSLNILNISADYTERLPFPSTIFSVQR